MKYILLLLILAIIIVLILLNYREKYEENKEVIGMAVNITVESPAPVQMSTDENKYEATLYKNMLFIPRYQRDQDLLGQRISYIDNIYVKEDNCYKQYNMLPFVVEQEGTVNLFMTSIVGCY